MKVEGLGHPNGGPTLSQRFVPTDLSWPIDEIHKKESRPEYWIGPWS